MLEKKRSSGIKTVLSLLLIYAGSVLVRFLLAQATRNYPTVSIDEFLYYSLGRSIATEGALLYHGQPAIYNYVLYPLILSPIYTLFSPGTNYYRLIQLWSILIMSLSVFPIYGICNAFVSKRKTALWMTAVIMLLPDFILGQFIYSEAVIYPLFYTVMYCIFRYLKDPKIKYSLLIGILGSLMYYTKPGALVPSVLAMLFFAGKAVKDRSGKDGLKILAGLAAFALVFISFQILVVNGLNYQGSFLSIYDDQVVHYQNANHEFFYRNVALYPYYFLLACGILPFLVSLWRFPKYQKEEKQFYVFMVICVLITMIGIAWIINRPERKDILYLRYIEMYIPIFLIYSVLRGDEQQGAICEKANKPVKALCFFLLVYVAACTMIWGSTAGVGGAHDAHFLISLSVLFTRHVMGIANIIVILLCAATLYILARNDNARIVSRACCVLFAVLTVLNNIQAYVTTAENTDAKLEEETMEIHQMIGDKEYLHVYTEDQCDYGLDVNSHRNIFQVVSGDFFRNIRDHQGKYVPFVPSSSRGMRAVYETTDTDTLIIDEKAYPGIQFNRNVSIFTSADKSFKVVGFTKGERIVDSLMSYSEYPTISKGSTGTLAIYNDEWLQHPMRLRMEIESSIAQDMEVATPAHQFTIQLNEGRYWYEIVIDESEAEYSFTVQSDSIQIHNYEIADTEPAA